jgi:DNA-binding HxlR family transcriptional regulator
MNQPHSDYAAYITLDMLGGKWSLLILCHLRHGPIRFCEFPKKISGLTQKVLTQQLRKLEANHLVTRVVYPEIPPKVEYTLTPHGKTLIPILDLMNQWGQEHDRQYIE